MNTLDHAVATNSVKILAPAPDGCREKEQWEGEMFRLLVENVKDYAIFLVDAKGHVISWSKGAERLLGYTEAEIIGHPLDVFFTPEDINNGAVEQEMRKAAEKGRGEDDRWHVRKDGTLFWCSGVLTPLKDEHGSLRGYAKIMRDLTEQKRYEDYRSKTEAALREQTDLLELATVFARRLDGTILFWNKGCEDLYGFSKADAIDATSHSLLNTSFPKPLHDIDAELLDKGWWQGELIHRRRDGSEVTVTSRWLLHREHDPATVVEVNTDITQQKQLQASLEQANRNKDEFLAMLAHELRNPLAPVLTAVHILRHRGVEIGFQQQAVNMVERQVRHMSRLVDDLLEVARIGKGKVELKKELVELNPLLLRVVETCRPIVENRKHQLFVSMPNEQMWLNADPTRVEQVISNILNNAAKYTEDGGQVWITAYRHNSWAVINIRDTGIGIDPKTLPQLFNMFKQAERSLDRAQGGLGVGLALVKRLVELHGGTVEGSSPGLGKGAEFTVRLPLASEANPSEKLRIARPKHSASTPLRVLVVDDNRDAADSAKMLLGLNDHDVHTADSGPSGLEEAIRWHPDVILLDIGLPGMDGYEVARRLRERPDTKNMVIIATTGYGQEADRQLSDNAGIQYHLVKPVAPQLVNEILTVVAAAKNKSCPAPAP